MSLSHLVEFSVLFCSQHLVERRKFIWPLASSFTVQLGRPHSPRFSRGLPSLWQILSA